METSLRFGADSKALRIHAKEKLPIDSKTYLQIHGELDTKFGAPTYFSAVMRHFYPNLSASLGVGLQYTKREKLRYSVRGKKSFPVTTNGLLSFNIKGRCDVDNEFKERKSTGAAEFTWSLFNFQKDQDVRVKLGYEVLEKVPYLQIRENNWTFNADVNGRWNGPALTFPSYQIELGSPLTGILDMCHDHMRDKTRELEISASSS